VVNLSKQSKHWPKSMRMETLPEFALELEIGKKMVSFDIQEGKRDFRFADERLVPVQVRRAFLQVHRPSVRVGSEPDVTYLTNGIHGSKANATVSSSRVL
jgi:hypothetical protein